MTKVTVSEAPWYIFRINFLSTSFSLWKLLGWLLIVYVESRNPSTQFQTTWILIVRHHQSLSEAEDLHVGIIRRLVTVFYSLVREERHWKRKVISAYISLGKGSHNNISSKYLARHRGRHLLTFSSDCSLVKNGCGTTDEVWGRMTGNRKW